MAGPGVSHRTLQELFRDLARLLHPVVDFHYLSVVLHDSAREVMRIHALDTRGPSSVRPGMEFSLEESPSGWVWKHQEPLLIADIEQEARFVRSIRLLREQQVRSFCSLPLTTPRRQLGAFNLGSSEPNAYTRENLEIPRLAASQVAVAVENALNYQEALVFQEQVARERDRLKLMLDVNNAVVSNLSLTDVLHLIPARVRVAMQCDAACLSLPDLRGDRLQIRGLDFPEGKCFLQEDTQLPIDGSSPGKAFRTGEVVLFETPPRSLHITALQLNSLEGFQSGCFVPLSRNQRRLGVLHLLDRNPGRFSVQDAEFLQQVANQVAIALDNSLQFREVDESR